MQSGIKRACMCCNDSKKAAPQLHAVPSTWSSCVELPVKWMFMGIAVNDGLAVYGGDTTDAYTHSCAPNDTFLAVDDAYNEWYKDNYGVDLSKRQVLPVQHALQGHPEIGKMWMHMIDNILIKELGFRTTTHDFCIYLQEQNGSKQLLLQQIDAFAWVFWPRKKQEKSSTTSYPKFNFQLKKKLESYPLNFLVLLRIVMTWILHKLLIILKWTVQVTHQGF